MLVLINAYKSITRSKGRNILVGLIVLAIAVSSSVALAIRNAAREAEAAGAGLVKITASITLDRQKLMEGLRDSGGSPEGGPVDTAAMRELMESYRDLNLSELSAYAQSDYVDDFYYSSSISLDANGDLEAYGAEASSVGSFPGGMGPGGRQSFGGLTMGDFTLTGYSTEGAMEKFVSGTAKVTQGEMFDLAEADMNCLISNELALYNNLALGDSLTLANPRAEEETYTFTIAGIYTDSAPGETGGMRFSTALDPANQVYISYKDLESILENSASVAGSSSNDFGQETTTALLGQLNATFVFASKENYDSFSTELGERGLSEYYTLSSTDVNSYESSLLPLRNLSDFASTLLYIVLVIGAVILVVINVFNIRERKYEVGVLTAIGIKKSKVALQFVTELMCVALLAIIVGAGIGAVASVPVSNRLLSAQIEQIETQAENRDFNFGRQEGFFPGGQGGVGRGNFRDNSMMSMFSPGGQGDVNYLDKINATVGLPILAQLMGIGIALTILSSLAAVVFVMRYEPLRILADRT